MRERFRFIHVLRDDREETGSVREGGCDDRDPRDSGISKDERENLAE